IISGFFSRRKNRGDDDFSHDDIDSPTSPAFRQPPNLPFIHEHNYSDSSIATVSSISEQERVQQQQQMGTATRRTPNQRQVSSGAAVQERNIIRVFATMNLKLYSLVDLTDTDTPDAIRKALCLSLG